MSRLMSASWGRCICLGWCQQVELAIWGRNKSPLMSGQYMLRQATLSKCGVRLESL